MNAAVTPMLAPLVDDALARARDVETAVAELRNANEAVIAACTSREVSALLPTASHIDAALARHARYGEPVSAALDRIYGPALAHGGRARP